MVRLFNESLFLSSEDALGLPESSNIKVTRAETVALLFDEFRKVAKMFSFHGEYQHVMTEMITHMQENSGTPFKSPYLDKALKEQILGDQSDKSSLLKINDVLRKKINYENGNSPSKFTSNFKFELNKSTILPKFNLWKDMLNGLIITVHDTWSTHITLEWLEVSNDTYQARIHYRVQDHFGLDDADILNPLYRQARVFRLWFVLQHWNEYPI